MSCPNVGVCFGCVLAGLEACPFRSASTLKPTLPLVEHERPKVIYRGVLTYPKNWNVNGMTWWTEI